MFFTPPTAPASSTVSWITKINWMVMDTMIELMVDGVIPINYINQHKSVVHTPSKSESLVCMMGVKSLTLCYISPARPHSKHLRPFHHLLRSPTPKRSLLNWRTEVRFEAVTPPESLSRTPEVGQSQVLNQAASADISLSPHHPSSLRL